MAQLLKEKWNPPMDTQPSFKGRTVLITGANTGIGYEAALKFVRLGADRLILGVRTISKGETAKRAIEEQTDRSGVVEVWQMDMLDYASIKAFAKRAESELEHLDVAVLNAGVIMSSYTPSSYGHETILQVNVLSTVLLAALLMPKLKSSQRDDYTPVLEIIGSNMHNQLTRIRSDSEPFAGYDAPSGFKSAPEQYAVSKLFLMYAIPPLVQMAMSADGKPQTYVTVVCPGATKSEFGRDFTQWYMRLAVSLFSLLQRQTEEGARVYISGVCQGEKANGRFWRDDEIMEPAPLLVGEKGHTLQRKVWSEIVTALQKDVPEAKQFLSD